MSTISTEQAKDLRNAFECWQQDYDPVEDKEQYDMFGLGIVAMDELLALRKERDKVEPVLKAAEKLVRCKGRYHSEQNYRALAALFGVTTPDLPPLEGEALRERAEPAYYLNQIDYGDGEGFELRAYFRELDAMKSKDDFGGVVIPAYTAPPATDKVAETAVCPKCGNTGLADSGGVQPWGEPILIECDCTAPPAPDIADDSLPYDPQIAEYEQMMEAEQAQADTTSQQFESLAGKAVGGLIPCGERMPEIGEEVLMRISCNDHFNIESGKYKGDGLWLGCWFSTYGKKGSPYQVTHWMPIPAAPEPCK
ncbi:DUF551 domain-containing protein [Cronobacter sakazakii]|nr:DUF551 domain-containing protein [Cronobacter sakazakii]ELY4731207.1 DUF551 domain-containing protein [Cronobacter sakazakii]ELY4772726.1 DUF551 domain-containing protein [Cronobacter sakazakii]ELY4793177.1 DUF551 domain-containing protein [Cronobacter sakazakii]ELY5867810.1 DUF551 domain-containing protein [Cronobacter sakazakii]